MKHIPTSTARNGRSQASFRGVATFAYLLWEIRFGRLRHPRAPRRCRSLHPLCVSLRGSGKGGSKEKKTPPSSCGRAWGAWGHGGWLLVVAGQARPRVVGNCVDACVRVSVCARGGVDWIPTGRGCMSCNTRERRLNFVVLGEDGWYELPFFPPLLSHCIDSGIGIGGIRRTHAHAQSHPPSQSLCVTLEM